MIKPFACYRLADNLPVATPFRRADGTEQYDNGYLLGMYDPVKKVANLHNHLEFTVKIHSHDGVYRIVGFEVQPKR